MTSSIYPLPSTANGLPIAADTDILASDVAITTDMVKPGGGGILRLYFTFTFAVSPGAITVFRNGTAVGTLNADNAFAIVDTGYYRFDIDVEAGDLINLQSDQQVTLISNLRFHLVQFGA